MAHDPADQHAAESAKLFSGSPYKAILRLALPTVIAMLSQSAVNEIDVLFFSRLPCPESSNGQAALLPSLLIVWFFGGSLSAISVGTQALTARRYAQRKYESAGAVLANASWFCLLCGAAFSIVGLLSLKWLLTTMVQVHEVRAIAFSYSRWRLLGVISMAMTMAIKAFFDGVGKTYVHLVAAIVMNLANVLLCYMFVFGEFGAHRMGPAGAGFAAFLSTWIGLAIMIVYAGRERERFHPMRWSNISRPLTWDLLKLSIPAGFATAIMMFGFMLFARVAGRLDVIDARAHITVGKCGASEAINGAATTDIVEILKLTFTACLAFGTAAATLVSQSLGAGKPNDAAKYGWACVRLGAVIFGVIGLCEGVFFTPQVVDFFSRSNAVRAIAITPMRIMGIVTPIIAVGMILSEALFGAGNTRFVAVAQFLLIFGVLVPGAWFFSITLHIGLSGMWIAGCAYSILAAITLGLKFKGGSWKTIHL